MKATCEYCGKTFERSPSRIYRSKHTYCSSECGNAAGLVELTCDYCGKRFIRRRHGVRRTKHHYCNTTCSRKGAEKYYSRKVKLKCAWCNKVFYKTQRELNHNSAHRYCSRKCATKVKQRRVIITCDLCGRKKEVLFGDVRYDRPNYCSRWCSNFGQRKRRGKVCPTCGKVFLLRRGQSRRQKFCCKKCIRKSKPVTLKCDWCKVTIQRMPGEVKKHKNHFCSRKCSGAHSACRLKLLREKRRREKEKEEIMRRNIERLKEQNKRKVSVGG